MNDLMIAVERVVRPVRVGPKRKLRMREELLAHLTGMYERELAALGDEALARHTAVAKFGDPSELTRELEATATWRDRVDYRLDRWFGWRPTESAARYTGRVAVLICLVCLPLLLGAVAAAYSDDPADRSGRVAAALVRVWASMVLFSALGVFLLGTLYFKLRDSLHGAFGRRRSVLRVAGYMAGIYVVAHVLCVGVIALSLWDTNDTALTMFGTRSFLVGLVGYLIFPALALLQAYRAGRNEIRHTEWSRLEIAN